MDHKDLHAEASPADSEPGSISSNVPEKYRGTEADRQMMHALGKQQVLRRNFRFVTMLGFASTVMCGWEVIPIFLPYMLLDGGTALVFWGLVIALIGMTLVYASIAEVASMCPTAGGQYHWVSEMAPPSVQKQLSYAVGWLTATGWQVYLGSSVFIDALMIQGLIQFNNENYVPQRWHATLLSIGVAILALAFNTLIASWLPLIQGCALVLHVGGLIGIVIPLWIGAPLGDPREVLLTFQDNGNWGNTGLSSLIGFLFPLGLLVGYDCVAHMSEETHDASRTLTVAIMSGIPINALLNLLMGITLCFTVGDPSIILSSTSGQPFIHDIFYNATKSVAATNVMTAIIILLLTSGCVSELATTSRQLWAFSRDKAVPFHRQISRITTTFKLQHHPIPLPALIVSTFITCLLALINIGSTVALNAINSLGSVSVLVSYFLTISTLIHRRLARPLPPRPWSLGRYGLAVNIASLLFLTPVVFFDFWPLAQPVTATNLNWSPVMFCSILLVALVYYIFKARFEYTGPVVQVRRDD